jgi:hypothetical protein
MFMRNLLEQAEKFRNQQPGEEVPQEWDALIGMSSPWEKMPVFTYLNKIGAPHVAHTEMFVLYLNDALPFVEMYPHHEDRAGMSFVHLLAVPKERIYNAVSLRRTDTPLLFHMKNQVIEWMNSYNFRSKLANMLTIKYIPRLPTKNLCKVFVEKLEHFIEHTSGKDLDFYFHVDPNHSVGHLHMHCLMMDKKLITPAFELVGKRNVPYSTVVGFMQNQ